MQRKKGTLTNLEAEILSTALELGPAGQQEFYGFLIAKQIMFLMGAAFVAIGFILIGGGFTFAGQPADRWIGAAIVLVGAFDFAVMPLLLARRWRSRRARQASTDQARPAPASTR